MSDDADILAVQVRALERDLRLAKATLLDQYAQAALNGLACSGNYATTPDGAGRMANQAFTIAAAAVEERKKWT